MGLIEDDTTYATNYSESFPQPARPGIYVSDINTTKDASLDSHKKESAHKTTIADWEIYNVAESEANFFIVRVVPDVWISPLSMGIPKFYMKRMTKDLLDQLQVICMEHHTINLLAIKDKMRTMNVTTNTIPQYITALENSQLQEGRVDMPIPENYLMMVATIAMLFSERLPRAKKDFKDLEKG